MTDVLDFGAELKEFREAKKVTQKELGEMSGVDAASINKIESGKYNASVKVLSQVLKPIGGRLAIVEE